MDPERLETTPEFDRAISDALAPKRAQGLPTPAPSNPARTATETARGARLKADKLDAQARRREAYAADYAAQATATRGTGTRRIADAAARDAAAAREKATAARRVAESLNQHRGNTRGSR
jgi:hypothetical protein